MSNESLFFVNKLQFYLTTIFTNTFIIYSSQELRNIIAIKI